MILSAVINNGKPDFHPKDLECLNTFLRSHEGKTVWFMVDHTRPPRSLNQNSYYHGIVIKYISDYTGDDPVSTHEHMKEMFCLRFFTEDGTPYKISTTRLDTKQMKEYIDRIVVWAASEHSIAIPEPNSPQNEQ